MSMTPEGTTRSRKDWGIGWMIFDNQPKLNAISGDMVI